MSNKVNEFTLLGNKLTSCQFSYNPEFLEYFNNKHSEEPRYLEVRGNFFPRGGISIDVYCNYGKGGTKYEELAFYRLQKHDLYILNEVDNR